MFGRGSRPAVAVANADFCSDPEGVVVQDRTSIFRKRA
jgi:hypothetical protein